MQLVRSASWETDVLPAWQRAAKNLQPNTDVWGPLPMDVNWSLANLEESDVALMSVISSSDWWESFGSYQLTKVAMSSFTGSDRFRHRERINQLRELAQSGITFEPLIVVADSWQGKITVLDGNHRAVAFSLGGRISGAPAFVGISPSIKTFNWARHTYQPPR